MNKITVLILGLFVLTACGPKVEELDYENIQENFQNLTQEEVLEVAPNDIFISIIKSDLESVKSFIQTDPTFLSQKNDKTGDKPLGFAIKLKKKAIVQELMNHTFAEDILYRNNLGEGYVFLLSKYNYPDLIHQVVSIHKQSLGYFSDYEFGDLDVVNNDGQRALHVAASSEVVKVLHHHWHKGWYEYPTTEFMRHQDINGENYLHMAAREGRTEVIMFAVKKLCGKSEWEKSDSSWKRFLAGAASLVKQGTQMFMPDGSDSWVRAKNLVNWKNAQGNTPLMVAVKADQLGSVKALSQCRWTDYNIKNSAGLNALSLHLSTIDVKENYSVKKQIMFDYLLKQKTYLKSFYYFQKDLVNEQDYEGKSALHYAALIKDSYYYNRLIEIGDSSLEDREGHTPRSLRGLMH